MVRQLPSVEQIAMTARGVSITLIGPGGAGKTTLGAVLAERLEMTFVDLDRRFGARAGDISAYINRFGYDAYARENVETYDAMLREQHRPCVAALSSGFMTYTQDVHPEYPRIRRDVEHSQTTFVLLPSFDLEACVVETVRRQGERPFARSAEKEETVIRERFPIYLGLRARRIETMRPLALTVDELVSALPAS